MNNTRDEYVFNQMLFMTHIRMAGNKGDDLRQLGLLCGVSASTLSRIDNGQLPDLVTLMTVCANLDLNPCDYFTLRTWKLVE